MVGESVDPFEIGVAYPTASPPPPPVPTPGPSGGGLDADCARIILQCCALRAARLNADGSFATDAYAVHTSQQIVRLSYRPIYEEPSPFVVNCPAGALPIVHRPARMLTGADIGLEVYSIDEDLASILGAGQAHRNGSAVLVGMSAFPIGDAHVALVSLEVWVKAFTGNAPATGSLYNRFAFPKVRLYPAERQLENAPIPSNYEGVSEGNPFWGDGPGNDWSAFVASGLTWGFMRDTALPTVGCGATPVPA